MDKLIPCTCYTAYCEAHDGHKDVEDEIEDNWKNRSEKMRCRTCMYFVEKITNVAQVADHFIGRCRRHAPTLSGFPVVYSDDWCGDHKINEKR